MSVAIIERPQSNYRTYTDQERAKVLVALDLNEGNLSQTSRDTGVPITTISQWRDGNINGDVSEFRKQQKQGLGDLCEDAAFLFANQAIATVESSKGTQAATGAAIFIDKMRLLRDQSTQNIAVKTVADETVSRLIEMGWAEAEARGFAAEVYPEGVENK